MGDECDRTFELRPQAHRERELDIQRIREIERIDLADIVRGQQITESSPRRGTAEIRCGAGDTNDRRLFGDHRNAESPIIRKRSIAHRLRTSETSKILNAEVEFFGYGNDIDVVGR